MLSTGRKNDHQTPLLRMEYFDSSTFSPVTGSFRDLDILGHPSATIYKKSSILEYYLEEL